MILTKVDHVDHVTAQNMNGAVEALLGKWRLYLLAVRINILETEVVLLADQVNQL